MYKVVNSFSHFPQHFHRDFAMVVVRDKLFAFLLQPRLYPAGNFPFLLVFHFSLWCAGTGVTLFCKWLRQGAKFGLMFDNLCHLHQLLQRNMLPKWSNLSWFFADAPVSNPIGKSTKRGSLHFYSTHIKYSPQNMLRLIGDAFRVCLIYVEFS